MQFTHLLLELYNHSVTNFKSYVKPWFHVKIKLFQRILVFYF